jgi:beta-N-acetylhexosaminidase
MSQSVAACLFPGFPGTEPPEWLLERLERGLGGVCLFARNVRDRGQLASLTAALRAARPGVVIGIDEEGGDVTRLEAREGSSYPGNWALGFTDDVGLTRDVYAAIGSDLAGVGVNLDFAPVADVNSNPQNPVIGTRSFGADAELVSRHVAAAVEGLQRTGVAACAKHFPGHGDTSQDSHLELPTAAAPELRPFTAAIGAGVRSIMTAHVVVPALDDVPATLSRRVLHEVLRGELGFDGAVFTDALEMRAVSETFGVEQAAVRALAAGADALLLGHDLGPEWLDRIEAAVLAEVPEERIAEAADRVEGLLTRPVGLDAARRALLVEGDVTLSGPPLVVELLPEPSIAAGPARHRLVDFLPGAEVVDADGRDAGRPLVIVLRDAHRHAWQREAVEALPGAIVVETGIPLWRPANAAGYVATHGGGRVNLEAAAERLLG